MAKDLPISIDKVKRFVYSEYYDEQKWAMNKKLLRAAGIFVGSIILMRNFSDAMVI